VTASDLQQFRDATYYGAANVALISSFVAGQDGVTADEAKEWADEQRELGQRGEFYFACLQFCFKGTRPG